MPKTIKSAFHEFHRDVVNIETSRTQKALASRDWLIEQLNKLELDESLSFPFRYGARQLNIGSFQRKTKIRELDDIDLFFCFTADNAFYTKISDDHYVISTVNSSHRLKSLSDDGILNSRKVIEKVKNSLAKISQYKNADLHRRGEAATLSLTSYEWVFDIVPCFYTDTGLYLIPNGEGGWKQTNPSVDQVRITTENQAKNGKLLQLVRTVKYWSKIHLPNDTISSYLLENFVIKYSQMKESLSDDIVYDLRDFLQYLSHNIYYPLYTESTFQGDLNSLNEERKKIISDKSIWSASKINEALHAELFNYDLPKAISIWQEVFGNNFPKLELKDEQNSTV
ncbi:SMODS domain-containing nucleotidyltransferase [Flammeovirga kamogawensis]|uniref:Nucleotidyltransferase n=1 Tax=Flammeovirga kamogawensis TaxID=373891 RepID=A0ABX8GSX8_9BACT|nr:nucleotidyltransferase [Flammeovirga kamogawensis]MBB6463328.1 hypothetical protein [Flammeovirga kamogawensis]QWG06700.1 hypothetical protein KM029_15495 [Flammeovirga kamogawensis]TRX68521.1 nucleotidyltransferase [Flammeovirga kamogawensis]